MCEVRFFTIAQSLAATVNDGANKKFAGGVSHPLNVALMFTHATDPRVRAHTSVFWAYSKPRDD